MNKVNKLKTIQPTKGNLKISHFFHKKPTSETNSNIISPSGDETISASATITVDPKNEESKDKVCCNCKNSYDLDANLSKSTIVHDTSSELKSSPCDPDEEYRLENDKKRKISSPGDDDSLFVKRRSFLPETTTCTTIKYEDYITVKTPEKLFPNYGKKDHSSSSSIKYHSPESKANLNEVVHVKTPLKNHDMNIDTSKSIKMPSKTPKKSPKLKLFDKSPAKLEEFNVQIINNFIKITPSKSNRVILDPKSPGSSSKVQTSILQYMSSGSGSSKKAQELNETTPKKESPMGKTVIPRTVSKAKLKLDFSSCMLVESKEKEANLCPDSTFANLGAEFDDDWDITFSTTPDDPKLDLQVPQHCRIIESIETRNRITLKIQSTSNDEKAVCHLEGFWNSLCIKPNDIVCIKATKSVDNDWIINNDCGLLVYEPDFLISSTSIAQSVYCMRRKVLSEKYQGFEPTNRAMIIGVFVHTLLQHTLKNNIQTAVGVEKIMEEIISSSAAIRKMYEASISVKAVKEELSQFIPKIVDFIKHYVHENSTHSKVSSKNTPNKPWNGKIDSVDDIEENIWCPQMGMKGKVDVSIRSKDKIYPLELKTGRASMSLEHKGQVILYVMMMNTLGYQISSGLLHYLKEGLLTEINVTHKECRDIMILRNELAYFLTRKGKLLDDENCDYTNQSQQFILPELPEPIDMLSCNKCNYNVVCSSYIPYENCDISNKKNFSKIQRESISHLEKAHLDYFIKWSFLLSLENFSQKDGKSVREIYTMPPGKRAEKGRCLCNVMLSKIEAKADSVFEHTFQRNDGAVFVNFLASGIEENSYVIISTDDRPAVSSGFVKDITIDSLKVILDRDLSRKYNSNLFHLDTYDSSVNTGFNMACLALLIENSPRANCLRKMIIDKEPPMFLPKLPKLVAVKSVPILKRLNKSQQRAILKSLSAKDYLLIKGMPGTGKTATIVALVQLLVEVNKTVLITSHTHSAIDNVCVRLQKFGIDVLRLGSSSRISDEIKANSEYILTKDCKTPEEIEEIYNKFSVIAVTCLGSGHPLLSKRVVDICLVDESTQVIQPSVFRVLCRAKTFILIGDPQQLSPTVKNVEAVKRGMSESLFERLMSPEAVVSLNQNYRMNKTITALANALTYNGDLLIGSETVANAHLQIPNENNVKGIYSDETWIQKVLDSSMEFAVQIIDTNLKEFDGASSETSDKSYINIYEAAIAVKLVNVLLKGGVSNYDIGVIATYRDQVAYISRFLSDVDVSTVDQFQGKDKKIILYSCTKYKINSNAHVSEFNLLEDQKRLTVAITRAKHKLIIIGELSVIQLYRPFAKMLNALDENKFIKLESGKLGFNWNTLLN